MSMLRRHELTDSQWNAIKNRIPGKDGDPGRTGQDNRLFVNAVIYVAKTGIPWMDLPERYGNWNSVWRRFRRWSANGVWTELLSVLGTPELEELQLDSTTIKAHPVASGSRRQPGEKKKTRITAAVSAVPAGD
jgi:putative transposase